MKDFMGPDFLLTNNKGKELFELYAKNEPIYDFHCHLNARDIAEDQEFKTIGELWLAGDHYKWRAMRAAGIPETLITGSETSQKDKFMAFAKVLPYFVGNPLYHWAHLELQKYFGINTPLSAATAGRIWEEANARIAGGGFTARTLISSSNVELVATTEDPKDDLPWHARLKNVQDFNIRVVPTFRPDKLINISAADFTEYLESLGDSAHIRITALDDLLAVLKNRMDWFAQNGCRIADHSLETIPPVRGSFADAQAALGKIKAGVSLTDIEVEKYRYFMLQYLGMEYAKRGWVMQLHFSALRNNNSKLYSQLGPDCGVDSVGDSLAPQALGHLFDGIERETGMPKTILYTLNPAAYYMMATMAGNFQGGMAGKIQIGASWWFLDHRDGITEQLKILANTGGLGYFVGMLTDSRSFLSYARHDYFRRILCSLIGGWVEDGEVPDDAELLKMLIRGISVENARQYFQM